MAERLRQSRVVARVRAGKVCSEVPSRAERRTLRRISAARDGAQAGGSAGKTRARGIWQGR
ncbi:MAG: hypothetical protein RL685_6969 [Pseudomonadota bacterium]